MRALCLASGIAALSISAIAPVSAQEKPGDSALTARSVFERINVPALDILTPSARLDLLDYWDADSVYRVKTSIDGQAWFDRVDPDWVRINVSPVSTFDIKLLPAKGGNVVMTLYTVGGDGQARDTSVEFYDAATLAPLDDSRYFKAPSLKQFFNIPKGSVTTMKEIEEMIPFTTVEYSLTPGSDELSAKLTSEAYVSVDDWNVARIFLVPEVKAGWKGKYVFK